MRGIFGVLVGIALFTIGLAGIGFALDQMMTHADPNASLKAAAGLLTFVVVVLASVVTISY
jgi:formate-dependent nitrite reductase membrane component NrfD